MVRSGKKLQRAMKVLVLQAAKADLVVNNEKIKYMRVGLPNQENDE